MLGGVDLAAAGGVGVGVAEGVGDAEADADARSVGEALVSLGMIAWLAVAGAGASNPAAELWPERAATMATTTSPTMTTAADAAAISTRLDRRRCPVPWSAA